MAQNHLKFGTYTPTDTDSDGYQVSFATTSSDKSGRTMRGTMKNAVLFTVEAYNLKWTDIDATVASRILKEVMGKDEFDFYHFNVYTASWETGKFYAANFNAPVISIEDGKEKLSELSFQVTGMNPVL